MRRCTNCGKFPFCKKSENNVACDDWIKRDAEMKLNKAEDGYFEFERLEVSQNDV